MARPSPAATKTERLLNLVIALLATRAPMSKARIRQAVPQYQDSSDEAFDRMFERDKDELRELGIPLRTEPVDAYFDDEPGYRIDRREYALPEIAFEPDELAVIGLASRAWSQAALAGPAARAVRKLQAAGVATEHASVPGIEPLLHTTEPSFDTVRAAVLARQEVTFDYRGAGQGGVTARQVQPWALTSWHGRWYLTGHDLDRQAPRVFRLDRIEGPVRTRGGPGRYPVPEHDPREMITASARTGEPISATVAVAEGHGHMLRRRAVDVSPGEEGWDLVRFADADAAGLVEEVASLGPRARVVEPQLLAAQVRERLQAVLAAHERPGAAEPSEEERA
ncbi:helix-turn-helix transcriptional regulator [Ornithinicoccus halotolerans]|uniref:helix-turn-helix transcriptional regulator n=1 Tax=Ornithinicoccus halotolerans TaxID=1748220 RepID=UPI0012965FC1|nr:WYL domain-containing protein [Ornithinicoccus halotolerans]